MECSRNNGSDAPAPKWASTFHGVGGLQDMVSKGKTRNKDARFEVLLRVFLYLFVVRGGLLFLQLKRIMLNPKNKTPKTQILFQKRCSWPETDWQNFWNSVFCFKLGTKTHFSILCIPLLFTPSKLLSDIILALFFILILHIGLLIHWFHSTVSGCFQIYYIYPYFLIAQRDKLN